MRKVLFITTAAVGGAERVTISISKLLDKSRFDISIGVVDAEVHQIEHFIPKDFNIYNVNFRNPYNWGTFKLFKLLKQVKPDVVFCASPAINVRLIIAAKILGNIKIVVRNSNIFSTERFDVRLLMKLTYRFADKIILQQKEMLEELQREVTLPRKTAIALQNPIDKDCIREKIKVPSPYPSNGQTNYVWTARFAYPKGQDVLVKAFSLIRKKINTAHLYLVGRYDENDNFYKKVKNIVISEGISDYVHFIGFDPNPYRWIKYADCFILPSRFEGLPNALIEAMFIGKPCVATSCIPIIDRIIVNGYNGYTVGNEDSDSMAAAMEKAILLSDFEMVYKSADDDEFINIFEKI